MRIPFLGRAVDERFLDRRRRASSLGGIIGGVFTICLFSYRFYIDHVWSWDLFAVAMVFLGVKMSMMGWYLLHD